jgi:tetratricopeptide (TPR) repeat protein
MRTTIATACRAFLALTVAFSPATLARAQQPTPPQPQQPAQPPPPALPPEATSLFGVALHPLFDSAGVLFKADSAVKRNPRDVDTLIAAGIANAGLWRYRDAIALYTRASAIAPDDPRPYRYRGHRYISLRRFDAAIRDLEHGRRLDSLSYDIAYHLGLAWYLTGQFGKAADELGRCMNYATVPAILTLDTATRRGFKSCAAVATNDDDKVGMAEWRYRALLRAGRGAEAAALLAQITEGMRVGSSGAYYLDLLVSKGLRTEAQVLDSLRSNELQRVTVAYGLGVRKLAAGDSAGARAIFEENVKVTYWPAFGIIGSEVELARMGRPGAARKP